ncbi:MAG: Rrf2 family transcriptional regulator [Chloroflexi bacterium]|nr:Rrf2 family transcriptional regulator [Chloroflexota bacterium]
MKISAKDEYACLAVLELSLNYDPDIPIRVHDIAERQGIPVKFLFQIMQVLKQSDIVRSKRGTDGGYVLARSPENVSVGDVIRSSSGPFVQLSGNASHNGDREATGQFEPIWEAVDDAIASVLDNVSFATLVQQARTRDRQVMYHI